MIELFVAAALAPWAHPLAFQPMPGWRTGASGNVPSLYTGRTEAPPMPKASTAWMARNVRYRDAATSDPPNKTLMHLPRDGVIVWAVIFQGGVPNREPIRLDMRRTRRFDCCEATPVLGGLHELSGTGPRSAYSVIVRVYFGSKPTRPLRAQAQRALDRLNLPRPRR